MGNDVIRLNTIFDDFFDELFWPSRKLTRPVNLDVQKEYSGRFPNYPVSNVYIEEDGTNVIEIALAGFTKDDVNVEIKSNKLKISAKQTDADNETAESKRIYLHQKLAKRQFETSYSLSSQFDIDNTKVELSNGILKITLPLKEAEKPVSKTLQITEK